MNKDTTRSGGSATAAERGVTAGSAGRSLRPTALAAVVLLLVEYGLGMWVSLYAKIPSSDHGKGTFAAFGAAVAHGPVGLAAHAVLGTLLLVTAITVVVRAARARQAASLAVGTIALLAIIAAWLSGARFVGDGAAGESLGMAMTTAAALLCYVIIVFFRPAEGAGR